jgi:hypothetical protein
MKTKKQTSEEISMENTVKDNNTKDIHEVIENMGKEGWPFFHPTSSLLLVVIKCKNNGLN